MSITWGFKKFIHLPLIFQSYFPPRRSEKSAVWLKDRWRGANVETPKPTSIVIAENRIKLSINVTVNIYLEYPKRTSASHCRNIPPRDYSFLLAKFGSDFYGSCSNTTTTGFPTLAAAAGSDDYSFAVSLTNIAAAAATFVVNLKICLHISCLNGFLPILSFLPSFLPVRRIRGQ